MSQPFFSVIIPTRNRPELLESAVESVLKQDFLDYELIVSDNSDDKSASQRVVNKMPSWHDNEKYRLVSPNTYMHMPEHWEFCNNFAKGSYVLILTDRFVMRPSTLTVLAEKIKSFADEDPEIILWNVQSAFDHQTGIQNTGFFNGTTELLNPIRLAQDLAQFSSWVDGSTYFSKLPRGMNSI